MIVQEILSHQSKTQADLDRILAHCCEMVLNGQQADPDHWGMVAACVILPTGEEVYGLNHKDSEGLSIHGERAALNACKVVDSSCMIVTTLSPCNRPMDGRHGESCADMIAGYDIGLENVYCGYKDPSQEEDGVEETNNPRLRELCKKLADTFLKENFANGKVKGKSRPGRVKRAGASCAGSVADLRSKAKNSSGERSKMYHWCANMKSGKKK